MNQIIDPGMRITLTEADQQLLNAKTHLAEVRGKLYPLITGIDAGVTSDELYRAISDLHASVDMISEAVYALRDVATSVLLLDNLDKKGLK